jgi:ABC-2 type transport system permease protein
MVSAVPAGGSASGRRQHRVADFVRTVATVARRELLAELRQRNKLGLDLTGHLLGLAPVLLTAWAASGAGPAGSATVGGTDWLTFVLLGYIAFAAYGVASPVISFTGMAFALHDEQVQGTLERSLLAPAPRLAVVLGSGAYYTALYLFHVVTLLLVSTAVLGLDVAWTPGTTLLAGGVLLLIFVMSVGIGIVSAAVLLTWRDTSLMMIVIHRPMLLLSGAYFLIPAIPEPFRTLARLNPIAYAIDAFRGSLTGETILLPLAADVGVLLVAAIGTLLTGLYLFDRLMARWLRTGSLGIY